MSGPADSVFYPSLAANLRLRFDEVYHTGALGIPPLAVSIDDCVKAKLPAGSKTPPKSPQGTTQASIMAGNGNALSRVVGVVPTHAMVELPGYRQAGKWTMTLLFRDMPLDPRMIRAIGVEIYIGTVSAANFAAGATTLGGKPGVRLSSIIPTLNAKGGMARDLALVGVADEIDVDMSSGGYIINIEGRDLRGLLLDAKVRPGQLAALNLGNSIVQVVIDILKQHPLMGDITVIGLASDWPNEQIPSPGVVGDLTRVNVDDYAVGSTKGSGQKKPANRPTGSSGEISLWDIITRYCFLVGAIPYFQGEELWIRPALSIYDYTDNPNHFPNIPIPFELGLPRSVGPGQPLLNWRRMVFGRDIEKLGFKRKLGGTKTPAVEIVCSDTGSSQRGAARLLVGRYPEEDTIPTSVSPSGSDGHADVLRIPVHGISSQAQLAQIAQATWEEISRGEITGSVATKDLCSFGGDNDDADLLRLRPGDPIDIVTDSSSGSVASIIASEPNFQAQMTPEQQVQRLTDVLGDARLAQVLVNTANGNAKLPYTFRTNTVKYTWEAGKGIAVDFDFHNYVEARAKEEQRIKAHTATAAKAPPVAGSTKPSTTQQYFKQMAAIRAGNPQLQAQIAALTLP